MAQVWMPGGDLTRFIGPGWVIQDGNLVSMGAGSDLSGDIITRKTFEDFELSLDWAISEGGNSGIFSTCSEGDHPTTYRARVPID
ncbi:MAG: family 16 glycoside hydrolase [Bacteroidales bacterium]